MIKIGLCGLGYWGKNLFRTLSGNAGIQLTAVAGAKAEVREKLSACHPHLELFANAIDVIAGPDIDAVPRKMTLDFQELPT